jgi:hypothetical protein
MPARINLVGSPPFGKWTVLKLDTERRGNGAYWWCRCGGCGREISVSGVMLASGRTTQCRRCAGEGNLNKLGKPVSEITRNKIAVALTGRPKIRPLKPPPPPSPPKEPRFNFAKWSEIIRMRGAGLTCESIGKCFRITKQRVSQIIASIRRFLSMPDLRPGDTRLDLLLSPQLAAAINAVREEGESLMDCCRRLLAKSLKVKHEPRKRGRPPGTGK